MAQHPRQRAAARRLTAAVLLPRLMEQLKGEALTPEDDPALIADLLGLLEGDPDWPELGRALLEATPGQGRSARFGALWLTIQERLPARGHHHLALLHAHLGWRALPQVAHTGPTSVQRRWTRAMKHLGRVLGAPDFFAELGASCGAAPADAEALHADAARLWLKPHAEALIAGLHPEIEPAREQLKCHWTVLSRALKGVGVADDAAARLKAAAVEQERRVIHHVLHLARQLAADLEPSAVEPALLARPFDFVTRLTDVIGPREELTVWVIDQCVEWSWPLYKSDDSARLRVLIETVEPFGLHLERLLRSNSGAFGRQSKCATYLLFLADFRSGDAEEQLLERALRVCPGHRNSRLMISYNRLKKANAELIRIEHASPVARLVGSDAEQERHLSRAEALIDEAAELFPGNEKLDGYRERLAKAREKLG